MYKETVCRLGNDVIEVRRSMGLFGGPGKSRQAKRGKSTEERRRMNAKTRARYIQRLLLHNFKAGDLHVTLQYRKEDRPGTYEEGKERLRLFLKRLRKYYKDRGHILKYIGVTERGKRRAVLHHHIVIEAIDDNALHTLPAITKCWDGYTKVSVMYEDGNFEQLAEYLTKTEGKEGGSGASYIRSRSLQEPQPEKRIVFRKTWEKEPTAPEGWYLVKDSLVNGVNLHSGKPYQRYLLRRIKTTKIAPKPTKTVKKRQQETVSVRKKSILEKLRRAAGRFFGGRR